jgi:hypothetical protein
VLLALAVVATAAVVLVVVAQLAGPAGITPSRQMVIGTWSSASRATLTLNADGTFTARGLPANAGESSYGTVPSQGSGRWHVGPVPAEPPGVIFDFSPAVQMELLVEREGSALIMYYDKGDPDEGVSGQYQFTKLR